MTPTLRPSLTVGLLRILRAVNAPVSVHTLHSMLGGRRAHVVLAVRELEAAGTVVRIGDGRNGRRYWLAERAMPVRTVKPELADAHAVLAERIAARRAERLRA